MKAVPKIQKVQLWTPLIYLVCGQVIRIQRTLAHGPAMELAEQEAARLDQAGLAVESFAVQMALHRKGFSEVAPETTRKSLTN